MKKHFVYPLFICLYLVVSNSCNESDKKEFTESLITIPANDSVRLKEIDLTIINQGCGREWYNTDGEHPAERPYCELLIRLRDTSRTFSQGFEPIQLGEIQILMDKINPWGRVEDSVPPGGCRLLVRKTSAGKE